MNIILFSDPIFLWILVVLSIILLYKNFLYEIWFLYFNYLAGMEYYETSRGAIKDIVKIVQKYFPWTATFYDLGSSRWSLLFPLSKLLSTYQFIGIENIPFQVKFCRFLQKYFIKRKNLFFKQDDFFTTDISWADILFLYVPKVLLPRLQWILQKNMRGGQILILYRIHFEYWQPTEIIPTDFINGTSHNNIYIYQNT